LENKKKILILSSNGGGGHTAVSNALRDYLNNDYEIIIINVFTELLGALDHANTFSKKRFSGEGLYNYLLAHKWYRLINLYFSAGSWYYNTLMGKSSRKLMYDFFSQGKFDLIISVIPIVNNIALDAAEKANIPFLLIPTDLDIRTFIQKIKNPTYKKFKLAIPFLTPETEKVIKKPALKNQ